MSQPKAVKKKAVEAGAGGARRRARSGAGKGTYAAGLAGSLEVQEPACAADPPDGRGGAADAGDRDRPAPQQTRLVVHYARESGAQVPDVWSDAERAEPALRQLVLVGQPAESLHGLRDASRLARGLTELWLVESQVSDASAARECPLLEKLVLSTNRLAAVPELGALPRLHTLWLPGNRIAQITNLSQLPALEDLNLADNLICTVRRGLGGCKRLSTLNLSGNPLSSLKEARHLCGVSSLRSLTLADPVYGVTPMARLCNYRSCLLLHLPQLRCLDGFSVEAEEVAQLKEFYAAGGRHMSMLRRHAEARYMLAVRRLGRSASADLQRLREQFFFHGHKQCEAQQQRFEELSRQLLAQARARGCVHRLGDAVGAEQTVVAVAAAAAAAAAAASLTPEDDAAVEELVDDLARWTDDLDVQLDKHRVDYEMSFAELECELESVGNVAMSVHGHDSRLASVCQDLLDRFSCAGQFARWQLRRARVLRVTHVCSRGAEIAERWRPAEPDLQHHVQAETEGRAADASPAADAPPHRADEGEGTEEAGVDGQDDDVVAAGSVDAAESAESVELDECESLFQLLCSPDRELTYGPWPFRLLDFPALGAAEEPLLVSNCLALADSRWLQRRVPGPAANGRRLAPLVRLTRGARLRRTRWEAGVTAPSGRGDQCGMYRVLGPRPELLFLVEFQYEVDGGPGADPDDADVSLPRVPAWRRDVRAPAAVKHPVLDETLLARCVASSDWGRLTSVNLAGRGIKVLGELPLLPCVSQLDLSYNQLGSLGSLYAFPNLRSLNLAFNNFVTLVNMRDLPALESLNLSWNSVRQLLVVLRTLSKYTPALRCLQVCHNPVEDVLESAHGRHFAARYLPKLGVLDGEAVLGGDSVFLQPPPNQAAPGHTMQPTGPGPPTPSSGPGPGQPLARSKSSHAPLAGRHGPRPSGQQTQPRPASGRLPSGRRSPPRPPPGREQQLPQLQVPEDLPLLRGSCGPDELRLRWRADRGAGAETGSQNAADVQPDRYTLSAHGRGLTHVLDPGDPALAPWGTSGSHAAAAAAWLGATRWANLSDNLLGEAGLMQALAAMPHLLQLNVSRNTIEALCMTSFLHCPALNKLDLSRNYLRAFPLLPTKPLQNLQFLDLSCNQLQSLCGLEEMTALRELYLANNHIRGLQCLQPLRRLQRLCVLDLSGNEVCDDPNFRKFAVYHLRGLEFVNGQEVVEGDLVAASETFGGCLDRDAVLTQYTWKDMTHLVELHLPSASLRQVDLPGHLLPFLEVLDLSNNDIYSLWGLHQLPRLAVLDVGHNQVRWLRCPPLDGAGAPSERGSASGDVGDGDGPAPFPALHTLFLDHNGLTCLRPLALDTMRCLRTLFLHHNQLDSLQGLGQTALRGLVLDGNQLDEAALLAAAETGLLHQIRDLHLDGNLVHGLFFLQHTEKVERLFLAKNKIADAAELQPLRTAPDLRELCILGNPVCLRPRHFALVRELLPWLELLDGHPLDPERYLCPAAAATLNVVTAAVPRGPCPPPRVRP